MTLEDRVAALEQQLAGTPPSLPASAVGNVGELLNAADFLQLLADSGRKVVYGIGSVVWGGGSIVTANTQINHGLGVIPLCVIATPYNADFFGPLINANTKDAVKFLVNGLTIDGSQPANGTSRQFHWLAIG